MNRATKEDVMRFARAVWPSAPNLALASFDEKKALNDAADRIAELEEFIKVLLPSWPDGEHYPTEMSLLQMKQERIAELEKALREIVEFKPGTFWGLEDEIKIHQTAKKALGLMDRGVK